MRAASAKIVRARRTDHVAALDRLIFAADAPQKLDGRVWWLARLGRKVVGFAGMLVDGDTAFLSRAGVIESARGRGIHHAMIRARVSYARSVGCTQVLTYTLASNVNSANNLIAEGFRLWTPAEPWFGDDSTVLYWQLTGVT